MDNQVIRAFLSQAIELARKNIAQNNGGPFGALVVKNDEIVGSSENLVTSTPDPTAHAEIEAIRNASQYLDTFDLSGSVLFTSCEPCPMCLGAVYWARINKVYFAALHSDAAKIGFDDQFIYKELKQPLDQRAIPFEQHLQEEGIQVFEEWDAKSDKTMY